MEEKNKKGLKMKSSCVVKNGQPASQPDPDFHKIELTRLFMCPKKPDPYSYFFFSSSLIRLMSSSPILPGLILTCCDEKIQE